MKESDSEFVGAMVQSVMVFYGLVLALIAVNVWQSYNDVSKTVSLEATSFAALYRDVSGYPEPTRSRLRTNSAATSTRSSTAPGPSCARARSPPRGSSG